MDHSRKRKTYKKCNPSFWEHEFKHQSDVHDEFQASMGYSIFKRQTRARKVTHKVKEFATHKVKKRIDS